MHTHHFTVALFVPVQIVRFSVFPIPQSSFNCVVDVVCITIWRSKFELAIFNHNYICFFSGKTLNISLNCSCWSATKSITKSFSTKIASRNKLKKNSKNISVQKTPFLLWKSVVMPFISKDWRSPGEAWVKTEDGWEKLKVLECGKRKR